MKNRLLVWPFAGLLVAACASPHSTGFGDPGAAPAPTHLETPAYAGFRGHTMPTVPMARAARLRNSQAGKVALETGTLAYFGGKVLSAVKIQAIYWGGPGAYQAQLDPFLQGVAGNGFLGWLGEYDTPTQSIGGGGWLGAYVDTNAPSGTAIDDAQIQAELVGLINAGSVPPPDADTLYFFFFPAGVNITLSGQGSSCSSFCGYHETLVSGTTETYYAVLPDPATCGTSCDNQSGNYFADLTSVTTHELTEAVTDPEVGLAIQNASDGGAYPTFPNGWAAPSGGSEIGDLCAWQQGTYAGYNVQLEWSDQANGCVAPSAGTTGVDAGAVDTGTADDASSASDGGAGVDTGTGDDGGGSVDAGAGDDGGGVVDSGAPAEGGPSSCAHELCTAGGVLQASCDPCASQICASDSYCCATAWDAVCVNEVGSICGETCGGSVDAGGGGGGGNDAGTTPTCDHGICTTGDALQPSCDPCATTICASDPYCCATAWDSICQSEVASVCGQTCP